MSHRIVRTCALLLLAASTLAAQQPAPKTPLAPKTMTLNITVQEKSGAPVTGLTPKDITVLDNKTPVQFTSFKEVTPADEPLHVILVLDNINNTFEGVTYIRNQLTKYLAANPHLAYPTAIALANETDTQIMGGSFTKDGTALAATLAKDTIGLRPVNFNAGAQGASQLLTNEHTAFEQLLTFGARIPGRKVVIWFAPGWPLLPQTRLNLNELQHNTVFHQVVHFNTQLRDVNMTLYNINPIGQAANLQVADLYRSYLGPISKPYQAEVGAVSLQVESTHSGGRVLNDSTDLAAQLALCLRDLNSWYEVTFTMPPAKNPDELHELQVKLDRPHLNALSQDSYYAQPSTPTMAQSH
jgi:VWFA-related protein